MKNKLLFLIVSLNLILIQNSYSQTVTCTRVSGGTIANDSTINICPNENFVFDVQLTEDSPTYFETGSVRNFNVTSNADVLNNTPTVTYKASDYDFSDSDLPSFKTTSSSSTNKEAIFKVSTVTKSDWVKISNIIVSECTPGTSITINIDYETESIHTFTIDIAPYSFDNTPTFTQYCTGETPVVDFTFNTEVPEGTPDCQVNIADFKLLKVNTKTGESLEIVPSSAITLENTGVNQQTFRYSSFIADTTTDYSSSSSEFDLGLEYYNNDDDFFGTGNTPGSPTRKSSAG